jgi:two-component system, cell cycle sensor histidine kinase and response regulator CckA
MIPKPQRPAHTHPHSDDATEPLVEWHPTVEAAQAHQQALVRIGYLVPIITHEIRQHLQPIGAYAQLDLMNLPGSDPRAENAQEILSASLRANQVLTRLLYYTQQELGKPMRVHLAALLEDVTPLLQALLDPTVTLQMQHATVSRATVNPYQLEGALMLWTNRRRRALPEGGHLTVETGTAQVDDTQRPSHLCPPFGPYVTLTLTDNGRRIPSEKLLHLFELDSDCPADDAAASLELAACYGILRRLRGGITLTSSAEHGTSLTLFLPPAP